MSKSRGIYAFEFEDKSVYIGLTHNFTRRLREHKTTNTTVNKKIMNGFSYVFKEIHEYTNPVSASLLEAFYIKKYLKSGWTILNKAKPGNLGGGKLIWTKEMCINEAKKYNSRSEWQKIHRASYSAAIRLNCINDCTKHMHLLIQHGKWTEDTCKRDALKYTGRRQWAKANPSAYNAAKDHNWLEICCSHMQRKIIHGKWTLDACKKEAAKYNKREHWRKNSNSYYAAYLKGWMNECCSHMERGN